MIVIAWSFLMALSMLVVSSRAFLTAPYSDYVTGLSAHRPLSTDNGERTSTTQKEVDDDDGDEDNDYIPAHVEQGNERSSLYFIHFETDPTDNKIDNRGKDILDDGNDSHSPLDPWSIVWYIGSFGGLVAFFLIVSCSEWCCRRGARPLTVPYVQRGDVIPAHVRQPVTDSPPPPYHLFAPPPYDSINYAEIADKGLAGEKVDIYVITVPVPVPVHHPHHQINRQPPPA